MEPEQEDSPMYDLLKRNSTEETRLIINGGAIRLNHNQNDNDTNRDQHHDDVSYSSLDTDTRDDDVSFETQDFKSCATNESGLYTVNSRAFRRTFLSGLTKASIQKLEAHDGFEMGFQDFTEKRSVLALCALFFIFYLALGTFAYSYYFEKWSIIDSMYFTVVTFTTCGYGDLYPQGDHAKLFTLFFIIIGIVFLGGLALTILFENVFGAYEDMIDRAKEKSTAKFMRKSMALTKERARINMMMEESNFGSGKSMMSHASSFSEERESSYWLAIWGLWPFMLLLVLGGSFIGYNESWDPITSAYYFVVTATSVGYGDISPDSQVSRLFAVVFIPCSVMVIAELFGRLVGVYLERKTQEAEDEFLNRRMTLADFDRMDMDHNNEVTYDEFIKFFLVTMGKVKESDMDRLKALYDSLDVNNDGTIQVDDLALLTQGENRNRTLGSILDQKGSGELL